MPCESQDSSAYLSRVRDLAQELGLEDVATAMSKPDVGTTKAIHICHINTSRPCIYTAADILQVANPDNLRQSGPAVCIVENISPTCLGVLGPAWGLKEEFFVYHAANPSIESLWPRHRFKEGCSEIYGENEKPYDHIDGWFEYKGIGLQSAADLQLTLNYFPRSCFKRPWGVVPVTTSCTRISYYRVDPNLVQGHLYLILVDAPIPLQGLYRYLPRRVKPILRLPYAKNLGGLRWPQLLEQDDKFGTHYSIFESLRHVFKYQWHRRLLLNYRKDESRAFPASPLCSMISSSLWQENLKYLTKKIEVISFEESRKPNLEINNALHDCREDLVGVFKTGLAKTADRIPPPVISFWTKLEETQKLEEGQSLIEDVTLQHPGTALSKMVNKAEDLEKFLMETFQLLMSSVRVEDGRRSNQQASRVTQLTILASVYAFLSFGTGIFGMNVKEFNGSKLSIWVFVITLMVVTSVTTIMFLVVKWITKKGKGIKKNSAQD